jgi:hypothetical protein
VAAAPESFDAALADAEPIGDLATRLDPLFADCTRADDFDARQCAVLRDLAAEQLHTGSFVALGDASALTWTPWSTAEKQLGLEVEGCLACGRPIAIAGRPRFVTTRVPKAIKAGRAVGLEVGFHGVPLPSQPVAARFVRETIPRLRVQFVFRVGPTWVSGQESSTYEGVTFVPVAHRVFDRCTGEVVASDPPSQKRAEPMRDASCPALESELRERELRDLPEQLSRIDVVRSMRSIESKVRDCLVEFEVSGPATVQLVLDGGKVESLTVLPPHEKSPAGYCIKNAAQALTFPRFRGEKMTITYPFLLR